MSENTKLKHSQSDQASARDFIYSLSSNPFPGSERIYVQGSRADILVPMRKISCNPTPIASEKDPSKWEQNEPIYVYETAGAYSDPNKHIDVTEGLEPLREGWITERDDTEILDVSSSEYARLQKLDIRGEAKRFQKRVRIRKAVKGSCVTQMHYARRGIITPEMEFIAIRENQNLEAIKSELLRRQHPGESFGANIPDKITAEFVRTEVAEGRVGG